VITLEDEPEVLAAQRGKLVVIERQGGNAGYLIIPLRRFIQTTENIHQRGFAGAGCADNRHHFTGMNRQIDVFQYIDALFTVDKAAVEPAQR